MARNDGITFMRAEEFAAMGERCFGAKWQTTFQEMAGLGRVSVNQYSTGANPIPAHIAMLMRLCTYALDTGHVVEAPQKLGRLVDRKIIPLEEGDSEP